MKIKKIFKGSAALMDNMTGLEEIEREVASIWEDMAESRGYNRVVGTVLFILMVEGRPLSQKEIAEKTGYSLPTISRALNTIVALGTAKKTATPGSRLRRYRVEMRSEDLMVGGLANWLLVARTMRRRVSGVLDELGSLENEEAEKAENLKTFLTGLHDSLPRMIEIIQRAMTDMSTT
jgi:DNA-binding transcriptional regulator GbsR (MarR family)